MKIVNKLKDAFAKWFDDSSKSENLNYGISVSIAELVKEQFNTAGLHFFDTVSQNINAGVKKSPFKGKGMEFDEVRLYQNGDDVRAIDWRVTARRGETYTKLFREERERDVFILVDMRNQMKFGTRVMFKSVLAAKVAALVSWVALNASEKVGGIVVSDNKNVNIKPRRSKKNLMTLFSAIASASDINNEKQNDKSKSLTNILTELRRVTRSGGIVFVISDFSDFSEKDKFYLSQIRTKSDVVLINIVDKIEEVAPPSDRYLISDGYHNAVMFADDYLWREKYENFFKQKRKILADFCNNKNIKYFSIRTDEDYPKALFNAFSSFSKKR